MRGLGAPEDLAEATRSKISVAAVVPLRVKSEGNRGRNGEATLGTSCDPDASRGVLLIDDLLLETLPLSVDESVLEGAVGGCRITAAEAPLCSSCS